MAYVSGHGPLKADKTMFTGRVGADVDLHGGVAVGAANRPGHPGHACANTWAASTTWCASSKCWAWSIARPTSPHHPQVINGCSELFRDLWGEDHGVGARSAVGMGSLPGNITTEIEAIFELDPARPKKA